MKKEPIGSVFKIISMKTSSSGGLNNRQEDISSRRNQKIIFMKASMSGGLKSRQEFISLRRCQEAYFHEDLLVKRIEESPRGNLLEATTKKFILQRPPCQEDYKVAENSRSDIRTLYMKTSSSGGLQDCQEDISSR